MQDKSMNIPPKPKLFQWYKNENKKMGSKSWNIWVVQRGSILWGFYIDGNGNYDLDHTNLRYWNEKDYPWEKVLQDGDITTIENKMPSLIKEGSMKEMITVCLNEHEENSKWFFS